MASNCINMIICYLVSPRDARSLLITFHREYCYTTVAATVCGVEGICIRIFFYSSDKNEIKLFIAHPDYTGSAVVNVGKRTKKRAK